MNGAGILRSRRARTVVLVLIALVLTAGFIRGIATGHLGDSANIAQILGLALDLGVLVVPSLVRTRQPATTAQLVDAADLLAEQVTTQWRAELGWRGMSDPEPIRTEWYRIGPGRRTQGSTTNVAAIAELFLQLENPRLVLVGGAGMGKTTLAALLLVELNRRRSASGPVTVLVRVADWDPTVLRFDRWLARRLAEEYPALRASQFGPDAAAQLVSRRLILPILDGLDEAPGQARGPILAGLNRYLSAADPLILTCRKKEYETAGEALRAAEVYEAKPVTTNDVVDYLQASVTTAHEDRWRDLLASPEDTALRFVDSPFVLWLIRTVYVDQKRDPAPLADQFPSAPALLDHLLRSLVPATLGAEPAGVASRPSAPRGSWDVRRATGYLEFLADSMTTHGLRTFGWWDFKALAGPVRARLSQIAAVVALFTALHATFIVLIMGAPHRRDTWLYWLDYWWRIGLREGMVDGVMVAILLVASYEVDARRRLSRARTGYPRGFAARLAVGLIVTMFCYGFVGAAYALTAMVVGLGEEFFGGFGYGVAAATILGFRASGPGTAASGILRSAQLAVRLATFTVLYLALAWVATSSLVGHALAYSGWLTTGLVVAIVTNSQHEPRYAKLRLRGRAALTLWTVLVATARGVVPAVLALLAVMVPMTLYVGLTYENLDYGLLVASIVAATFAVGAWLVVTITTATTAWATIPWPSIEPLHFHASLRRDRWSTAVRVGSTAVAILICVALGMWAKRTSPDGLGEGFEVADNIKLFTEVGYLLPGAAMLVVVAWLGSAGTIFDVSAAWLAAARRLPRRIGAFLEDCHRAGILREVGPRYEFRHAIFQDHLAAAARSRRPQRGTGTADDVPEEPERVA